MINLCIVRGQKNLRTTLNRDSNNTGPHIDNLVTVNEKVIVDTNNKMKKVQKMRKDRLKPLSIERSFNIKGKFMKAKS